MPELANAVLLPPVSSSSSSSPPEPDLVAAVFPAAWIISSSCGRSLFGVQSKPVKLGLLGGKLAAYSRIKRTWAKTRRARTSARSDCGRLGRPFGIVVFVCINGCRTADGIPECVVEGSGNIDSGRGGICDCKGCAVSDRIAIFYVNPMMRVCRWDF